MGFNLISACQQGGEVTHTMHSFEHGHSYEKLPLFMGSCICLARCVEPLPLLEALAVFSISSLASGVSLLPLLEG
jgi:hypothetical protein